MPAAPHDQPVRADLHGAPVVEPVRRERADTATRRSAISSARERREARVLLRGGDRHPRDRLGERAVRPERADAAAQLARHVERDERARAARRAARTRGATGAAGRGRGAPSTAPRAIRGARRARWRRAGVMAGAAPR